ETSESEIRCIAKPELAKNREANAFVLRHRQTILCILWSRVELRFRSQGGHRCQQLLKSCRPSRPGPTRVAVIYRPALFVPTPWLQRKLPPTCMTTSSAISGPAIPAVTAS